MRRRTPFFGPRRLRLRTLRLRDAVFLLLPVVLLMGWTVVGSVQRYRDTRLFDDWYARRARIADFVDQRLRALLHVPEAMAIALRLDPERDDPRLLRLQVPRGEWGEWQGEPLAFSQLWVDADIVRPNGWQGVEIRKRGDTSIHWVTEKKSFTLKTDRDRLFKGYRELAWSAKLVVDQYVTHRLASEYGVLMPWTTVSPVFVNDRFQGLYRLTELVDESFLRRRDRMPGNIFRGDTSERGEVFRGVPRGLFENPYIWDRVARNDRPSAPGQSQLFALVRDTSANTWADHERLMARFDRDELSRMFAYLLVTGDPYHTDNLHNHFWYEDPANGRLHPIAWDIRLFRLTRSAPQPLNALFKQMLRDPTVLDGAMRVIAAKLQQGRLLGDSEALLDELEAAYPDALRYDRLRDHEIPAVGDSAWTRFALRSNAGWLEERTHEAKLGFHAAPRAGGGALLDAVASGWAAVELVALRLPAGAPGPLRLLADRNGDGRPGPGDQEVPARWDPQVRRLTLVRPERLLPGIDDDAWELRPGPLHYRFFLLGEGAPAEVEPELRNALTGEPVAPDALAEGAPVPAADAWHPWRAPREASRHLRLAGDTTLRETLRIGPADSLEIAPGTTIHLAPDVSILSYGRVVAQGTAERPIALLPVDPQRPWGAFVLQGPGADGSELRHVEFRGGGGAELEGVEYKGMVSVHYASRVRVDHGRFSHNLRSDDAFNGVHAQVTIRDSWFHDTNADALDFDQSDALVADSRFERAGNDALDLMTTRIRILRNQITDSADKGISVGEDSPAWIQGNTIQDCLTGIEVKDLSEPWIVDNRLEGNRVALRQKAKNWRYGGGGWAKLVGNRWIDNGQDEESDARSRISRLDTPGAALPAWLGRTPRVDWRFRDDFESPADGWTAPEGGARLAKRDGTLVVALGDETAAVVHETGWKIPAKTGPWVAVVEVGSEGLREASLRLEGAGEPVVAPLPVDAGPGEFRLVPVALPAGDVARLRLEATPAGAGPARLRIRSVQVYGPDAAGALGG